MSKKYCTFCEKDVPLSKIDHWKSSGNYLVCSLRLDHLHKARREARNIKKWGVANPIKSKSYKKTMLEKRQKTMLKKYGVKHPSEIPGFKEKRNETISRRYGYSGGDIEGTPQTASAARASKASKYNFVLSTGQTIDELSVSTGISKDWLCSLLSKGGETLVLENVSKYSTSTVDMYSSLSSMLSGSEVSIFADHGIPNMTYSPSVCIKHRDRSVYVDVQSLYWGSGGRAEPEFYLELRKAMKRKGVNYLLFRSDEIIRSPDMVKSIILNRLKLDIESSKDILIAHIGSESYREYVLSHNLGGSFTSGKTIGIYCKNVLIGVASYWVKNKTLQLNNFAFSSGYDASYIFGKVIEYLENNEKFKFVSYYSEARCECIELDGFLRIKESLEWLWTNGVTVYPPSHCRTNMDERYLKAESYAAEMGLQKIYGAGRIKYVKSYME